MEVIQAVCIYQKIPILKIPGRKGFSPAYLKFKNRKSYLFSNNKNLFLSEKGWTEDINEAVIKTVEEWYEEFKDSNMLDLVIYVIKF